MDASIIKDSTLLDMIPRTIGDVNEFDRAKLRQYRLSQYVVCFIDPWAGSLLRIPIERLFYVLYCAATFGEFIDPGNFAAISAVMGAGRRLSQQYGLLPFPEENPVEEAHQRREAEPKGGSMGFLDITRFKMVGALIEAEISYVQLQLDASDGQTFRSGFAKGSFWGMVEDGLGDGSDWVGDVATMEETVQDDGEVVAQ